MNKIRIASDLHLEFNHNYRLPVFENESDTILILAGDICVADLINHALPFFEDVSNRFYSVLYVFGNHEYYNGSIHSAERKISSALKNLINIEILNEKSVEIRGDVFIGATLWTDYNGGFSCRYVSL